MTKQQLTQDSNIKYVLKRGNLELYCDTLTCQLYLVYGQDKVLKITHEQLGDYL